MSPRPRLSPSPSPPEARCGPLSIRRSPGRALASCRAPGPHRVRCARPPNGRRRIRASLRTVSQSSIAVSEITSTSSVMRGAPELDQGVFGRVRTADRRARPTCRRRRCRPSRRHHSAPSRRFGPTDDDLSVRPRLRRSIRTGFDGHNRLSAAGSRRHAGENGETASNEAGSCHTIASDLKIAPIRSRSGTD